MKSSDLSDAMALHKQLCNARERADKLRTWKPSSDLNSVYIDNWSVFVKSWDGFDAGANLRDFLIGLILAEIRMLEKRLAALGVEE